MPYIGNQPGTGVRSRFIYTATASQTTFTGADDNSKTLKYADSDYIDVYLNGVCLVPGTDYTASTKTSVVLTQAASLNDTLEVVAYDIATMADTVSKADGGTFEGDLGITNASPDLTLTNNTTEDTDGGRESTVTFKGLQSGGEESTLAEIRASHDATADDQKGDLIFKTNDGSDGASPTERLRIDSAGVTTFTGNIANTSGDLTLDVVGDIKLDADGGDIRLLDDGTQFGKFTRDSGDFKISSSENDKDIIFLGADGGSDIEAMRIDMSVGGYVGIGTSAPVGQLHLFTSDASISPDADADDLIIEANGAAGMTIGSSASSIGSIRFADSGSNKAGMIYYSHISNFMRFDTGAAERMRITSGGALLVGTTSDPSTNERIRMGVTSGSKNGIAASATDTNGGTALVCFKSAGTSVGSVSFNNNNTAFNTSSDYRLKENVTNVSDGITRVKQLAPKRFNWIDDDSNTAVDGFLAHEVQTVVPEAITGAKDAMTKEVLYVDGDELPEGKEVGDVKTASTIEPQNIDQSKLVPLLAAALKEAIAKIETLETKVAALEGE